MAAQESPSLPLVKVVGVSAAGKSSLVQGLRAAGFEARAASQEHSDTADMWQRIHPPQILIYLDADLDAQRRRRPDLTWHAHTLQVERERLVHARRHAQLVIDTTAASKAEVLALALQYLAESGVAHADQGLTPAPATGSPLAPNRSADSR